MSMQVCCGGAGCERCLGGPGEQGFSLDEKELLLLRDRVRELEQLLRGDTLVEHLAALAHEQWSGWMRYLFTKTEAHDSAELISSPFVTRWKRQLATPYAALPESEKESDRVEARRVLEVVRARIPISRGTGARR